MAVSASSNTPLLHEYPFLVTLPSTSPYLFQKLPAVETPVSSESSTTGANGPTDAADAAGKPQSLPGPADSPRISPDISDHASPAFKILLNFGEHGNLLVLFLSFFGVRLHFFYR
jgi:hypothetical protein